MKAMTEVYRIPRMDAVAVRRGVECAAGPTMDDYYPPSSETPLPAVVIVLGYPVIEVTTTFGCRFRETGMTVSWGQLSAMLRYKPGHPRSARGGVGRGVLLSQVAITSV
jgi:hypothetical protein